MNNISDDKFLNEIILILKKFNVTSLIIFETNLPGKNNKQYVAKYGKEF